MSDILASYKFPNTLDIEQALKRKPTLFRFLKTIGDHYGKPIDEVLQYFIQGDTDITTIDHIAVLIRESYQRSNPNKIGTLEDLATAVHSISKLFKPERGLVFSKYTTGNPPNFKLKSMNCIKK